MRGNLDNLTDVGTKNRRKELSKICALLSNPTTPQLWYLSLFFINSLVSLSVCRSSMTDFTQLHRLGSLGLKIASYWNMLGHFQALSGI